MEQHERHRVIIRAVDSGSKTIAQLCEITGASAVTIRRDLSELDALGAVDRVRGGARTVRRRGARYPLEVRKHEQPTAKRVIAKETAGMVDSGFSVLVDSGTTPPGGCKAFGRERYSRVSIVPLCRGCASAWRRNLCFDTRRRCE
ncbi:DeoR family transcriptional regulator [Corynebacterium pseudotuberculosis]|uniref:DeoR family transcriptional regulator n=1 Tax=Corynebacterium pseudotuberculosis TaxID=1719 RepID=UPI00227D68AB|nr:DeoR family transcriptional regulator [Corynebacterium pseudotuberculosis]WAF47252.1 DeoR family transcriptional regulator [Corynebacterium pseudotuberculosis]